MVKLIVTEIKFEIIEQIKKLSTNSKNGWSKELNLVAWNDAAPKYDLRNWSADHKKMGRGITLTKDELQILLTTELSSSS